VSNRSNSTHTYGKLGLLLFNKRKENLKLHIVISCRS